MFGVLATFLFIFAPANAATKRGLSFSNTDPVGDIAAKLPPGFDLSSADADGNGSVTWKELYDKLNTFKIPNLDTGVVKAVVGKFAKDGPTEGAGAGLDKAEFARMIAYFKKKSADALFPKNPNDFDTGCYDEDDMGESYRGLVTSTASGRTCQKWVDEKPHTVGIEPTSDNGLGNHNYCRNPDGSEKKPWCFTQDPTVEKEVCEVPVCKGMDRDYQDEADALSKKIAEGLECDCMRQLYGASTTTANTAVPLSMSQIEAMRKKCKCPPKKHKSHAHKRNPQ